MDLRQSPKYHLITFGCQMNKSDSERVASLLKGIGFEETEIKEDADLILINTCSVRQSAEDRVFGQIRSFKSLKDKKPELIIGITGCMPGRDKEGVFKKKLSIVDLYFPIKEVGQLPRWIAELRPDLANSEDVVEDYLKIKPDYKKTIQAFVSIQTGCNNFCTYCVVPFARGLEKNRPLKDIMDEVQDLAGKGCVEITLLGQTVNSYTAPDSENFSEHNPYSNQFAKLLWEVNQVEGISRLHFTAPHPRNFSDEIIDAMQLPAHLNIIHLPVQSGDNEVLRKMNRKHTVEDFFDALERLRVKIPNIAVATDLIVGFCGETDEQFEKTVELYKKADFDIAYSARYSARSGTAAYLAFADDVSHEEKKRRWNVIQEMMEKRSFEKNQKYVGTTVSVLVERYEEPRISEKMLLMPDEIQEKLKAMPGYCYGNSREMKLVRFHADKSLVGTIVEVKVTMADKWLLEGELI